MKGLLIKEWYTVRRSFLTALAVSALFIGISLKMELGFGICYLAPLFGMLPLTAMAQDEVSRWQQYACMLLQSRKQIVTAKYLVTLILVAFALLLSAVPLHRITANDIDAHAGDIDAWLTLAAGFGLAVPAVMLPLCFRFGTGSMRVLWILLVSVSLTFATGFLSLPYMPADGFRQYLGENPMLPAIFGLAGVFLLSWYLSVKLFERREL